MKPGDVIAERFEIEHPAGAGGMGAVYRAHDRLTGGPVAVKVLWAHCVEHTDRFTREAEVLAELHHPGIVGYVAHGAPADGEPYLVLEWLEGESLAERLRRKPLTLGETLAVGRRTAEALAVAHARGIVHRDLKPSNLYLVGRTVEGLKLLDFGIARRAGSAPLTMTGVVVGTPFYMAPEQARGDKRVDCRADVFALGCVLFHCVAGRAPFASDEVHAALLKVVLEEAPRLGELVAGVPPALEEAVARMLAKDPKDRPADGAAAAEELSALARAHEQPSPESARAATPALTTGERKVVCLVLARLPTTPAPFADPSTTAAAYPATMPMLADPERRERSLRAAADRHQGRLEVLQDGLLLVTLAGGGAGTDQAARAARCALAFRAALPTAPIALVAGRGVPLARLSMGPVIDRGVRLLAASERDTPTSLGRASQPPPSPLPPPAIRLDPVLAGLLDARFDVGGDADGLILRGERDVAEAARTLLGRPTPCVGREHELGILETTLDETIAERSARVVLVTAAAGMGKSRLLHELLQRARARRVAVWVGQADPMSAGSPFAMLAQTLRRELGLRAGEPQAVREQKLLARIGRHLAGAEAARVGDFLGELVGVRFADDERVELRAARRDPMLMGDQMRRAFEDFFAAECAAGPVLLALEDLHWGDLPTVKLIDSTLRNLEGRPLMVLALGRPEVHDLFPRLWAARGVSELRLRELGRKASERLVREVLGGGVDETEVGRLVERASGNAFYLEELIRAARAEREGGAESRRGTAAADGEGAREELPETVLAMVQARLEQLDPEARRILRAASVFGQVFWRGGVQALLGAEATAALGQRLSDLCDGEVLVRRGQGAFGEARGAALVLSADDEARARGREEYAFRHSIVRDAAHAMLTNPDRALGHRLAAEWLEQAGEGDAVVMAEHFERGGEPARALVWYRRAAEQALEGNDFEAAIARAHRGRPFAQGTLLGELFCLQAEAYKWLGDAAQAEQAAVRAMRLTRRGTERWFVAAAEAASMRLRLGEHGPLSALAEEVSALAAEMPATGACVSAIARLAGSLLHAGQRPAAEALIAGLARVAGPITEGDAAVAARVQALYASQALCQGDPAASLRFTERSMASFARTGDLRNACLGGVNAGHALLQLGRGSEAERTLRSARAEAERMGLHNVSALAEQNLGPALARRGALDEALAVGREAIEAFTAQTNRRQEGRARVYAAMILTWMGRLDAALVEADAAVSALAHVPPLLAFAQATRAAVLLARGDVGESLRLAGEAMDLLAALGSIEEGEALVRLVYAEARYRSGHFPAAADAIAEAARRLRARAAAIRDPGHAASFLERVPEHARTLELARAWEHLAAGPSPGAPG